MKVLFLQNDIFAKPGIMLLSAILKKEGHDVDVLIDDLERNMIGKALKANPDVIAFSITSIEAAWMSKIGKAIRQNYDSPLICGGAHPTYLTKIAMEEDYLDALCVGEGEGALVDFINALGNGEEITGIPNLVVRKNGRMIRNELRPLIEDLDSLPFWDRTIYDKYPILSVPHGGMLSHHVVITGRGCPYECSYCFNKAYKEMYRGKGNVLRRRSVTNVIEELKELKKRQVKFFTFEDDSFTIPPYEWLDEFLERYKDEIAIPFKFETPASLFNDDMMKKLKEANCYAFKMGVESGNEDYRRDILNKHVSDDDIIRAAHLAKKYGIRFQTFNMAGCPGETLDMVFETLALNRRIKPDFVWCSLFHPHPGTELYRYSVNNGYIEEATYFPSVGHSIFLNTPIRMKDKKKIMNLQKLIYLSILLHIPRPIIQTLIRLPFGRLYNLLFGVGFFIGIYRTNKTGFFDLIRISLMHWAKHIMMRS